MAKKYFNIFLFISYNIILLELFSYAFFKISNEEEKYNTYAKQRNGNSNYFFSEKVGLVFSKPNNVVYHFTDEFTDQFRTKGILKNNLDLGFFDNGIDEKKKTILAIGDSFTRGTGSGNNLKFGWVALLEKQLNKYNIVNLGDRGQGINQQFYAYLKLQNIIKHEVILYNFFSGNDYLDNLIDDDFNFYFNKILSKGSSSSEINNIILKIQNHHNYNYHMEYWNSNYFKSFSVYVILKVYDFILNKKIAPQFLIDKKNNLFKKIGIEREDIRIKVVNNELYNLQIKVRNKQVNKCSEMYCYKYYPQFINNEVNKDKIINNSVEKINKFYNLAKKNNKQFILIIHPWARNIINDVNFKKYNNVDQLLVNRIDKNIKYLILSDHLKSYQEKNPTQKIFHKYDGHYNKVGYEQVNQIIFKFLTNNLIND